MFRLSSPLAKAWTPRAWAIGLASLSLSLAAASAAAPAPSAPVATTAEPLVVALNTSPDSSGNTAKAQHSRPGVEKAAHPRQSNKNRSAKASGKAGKKGAAKANKALKAKKKPGKKAPGPRA